MVPQRPSTVILIVWALGACLGHAEDFIAGHQVFTVVDENRDQRELLTNVWYPVDEADGVGQPPLQYYQHYNDGADFWWYESPFFGGVQGAPSSDSGPFPLVVLSHGNGGYVPNFAHLGEALAREGYVTIAPRHTGNAWGTPDDSNNVRARSNRGIDLSFIMDVAIERSQDAADILFGAIDESRIAAGGYSLGVPTAASLLLGTNNANAPVPIDDRPQALFMIDGRLWWSGSTQNIDVPTMLVGGTVGNVTSESQFNIESPRRHTIHVENAHHWSFGMNLCQYADALEAANAPDEVYTTTGDPSRTYTEEFWPGCQEHLIDIDESVALVSDHAIKFFDTYLKQSRSAYALSPDDAKSLHVQVTLERDQGIVALTDPLGRQFGTGADGEQIDTFNSEESDHRRRRSGDTFRVQGDDIVAGPYYVNATNTTSDEVSMRVSTTISGTSDGHRVTTRLIDEVEFSDQVLLSVINEPRNFGDCDSSGTIDLGDLRCLDSIEARDVVLESLSLVAGDLNVDGKVGFEDFLILSDNFNTAAERYVDGNIDLANGVEFLDFLVLASSFSGGATGAVAVPETSTFQLLMFLSVIPTTRARRLLRNALPPLL